jgi:predicted O-methyltransferase YrrM
MAYSLARRLRHAAAPPPHARHIVPTWICSADDDHGRADSALVEMALAAAREADAIDLEDIAARDADTGRFVRVWPGEHYKLLAGLVKVLGARSIVEIGTATGASALALMKYLPADGRLTTFDVVPWRKCHGALLTETDFADGRLVQEIADVTREPGFAAHRTLFDGADLIFIDAAKDGQMEKRLLALLATCRHPMHVVFDDIRVPAMIEIWRSIDRPKLDLTSFGHWSGTGLVRWA